MLLATACLLAPSGCAASNIANTNVANVAEPYVLEAAERDLACPMSKLQTRRLLGNRYEVYGCGRKTTYGGVCDQLQCAVYEQGEDPPAWRDRPDPDTLEYNR